MERRRAWCRAEPRHKPVLSSIRVAAVRAGFSTDDRRSSEVGGPVFPAESEGDPGPGAGRAERRGAPAGRSGWAGRGAGSVGGNAIRPENCTARS